MTTKKPDGWAIRHTKYNAKGEIVSQCFHSGSLWEGCSCCGDSVNVLVVADLLELDLPRGNRFNTYEAVPVRLRVLKGKGRS